MNCQVQVLDHIGGIGPYHNMIREQTVLCPSMKLRNEKGTGGTFYGRLFSPSRTAVVYAGCTEPLP